jgi:hypothetical protein
LIKRFVVQAVVFYLLHLLILKRKDVHDSTCGRAVVVPAKVAFKWNFVVIKDTWGDRGLLLATTKLVVKIRSVVIVVSQLATTLCMVVRKITAKSFLWSLNF